MSNEDLRRFWYTELSEVVLEHVPHLDNDRRRAELAKIIERVVEAYIVAENDNYEPPDPPGFEAGFCDNH